ncbi:MAG: DUF4350 domain-containing protein [Planctomycetota bacterium]
MSRTTVVRCLALSCAVAPVAPVAVGLAAGLTSALVSTQVSAQAPSVLFVRGADRSGGFLEANNDFERTEQLADITNASTAGGNHGWKTLADTLTAAGFAVTQTTESVEPGSTAGQSQGVALDFGGTFDLSPYDVVVMGSNNAAYSPAQADALEAYLRQGGAVLFISDANFGSSWADASDSDQPFLDRLGLTMNQDQGTYSITRSDGEFLVPDHPILDGVDQFDGEGVTPVTVNPTLPTGVSVDILARAEGNVRRNTPPFGGNQRGPSTPAGANDAALLAGSAGSGRFVVHFDRNTFFNLNGAGTNITRFDNEQLALNLFGWLADTRPGDANADGTVDLLDFDALAQNFGSGPGFIGGVAGGDFNGDGVVDLLDFDLLAQNFGADSSAVNPGAAVVAEPATLGLLALAAPAMLRRRRLARRS